MASPSSPIARPPPSPRTGRLPPSPQLRRRPPRNRAPPSPRTRGLLYSKISSLVEGSFLDAADDDGVGISAGPRSFHSFGASPRIGKRNFKRQVVVTTQAVTDSIRAHEKESEGHAISFAVVYTMIFFNGCCFTAVVPSVPFYLRVLGAPPSFLGLVVSFYSLGQIVGSPAAGRLSDVLPSKTLLTLSSCLGLVASTLYAAAPTHWFVLASRFATGVSAGMEFTTELAFIARHTAEEERTAYLASVTAVNVLGFIMGPALTTLLSALEFTFMGLEINQFTGPGWLLVLMFFADLLMVRFLFERGEGEDEGTEVAEESTFSPGLLEDDDGEGATSYGAVENEASNEEEAERMESGTEPPPEREIESPSPTLVLSLIFVQFTVMCAWSVLETITSPLAFDSFGWKVHECNLLFTCGGAASLLAYVSFVVASKWIQDRWLIVYALVACFVGLILMIHWTSPLFPPYKYCFLVGYLIMNAGFMTGRPVTFALYSKLIPAQIQGKYLGYMVAGGSAARTLGPFAAVYLYYHVEGPWKNTVALFGSEGVVMTVCLALVVWLWPSLLPSSAKAQTASKECKGGGAASPNATSNHSGSANGDVSMHVNGKKLAQ